MRLSFLRRGGMSFTKVLHRAAGLLRALTSRQSALCERKGNLPPAHETAQNLYKAASGQVLRNAIPHCEYSNPLTPLHRTCGVNWSSCPDCIKQQFYTRWHPAILPAAIIPQHNSLGTLLNAAQRFLRAASLPQARSQPQLPPIKEQRSDKRFLFLCAGIVFCFVARSKPFIRQRSGLPAAPAAKGGKIAKFTDLPPSI